MSATGSTGERLVYAYTNGKWSRDVVLGGKKIISTAVHAGVVYFLTDDGNVYQETPAAYLDAGAWITMKVKTAWVHPAGPQGYQWVHRAIWLGDKSTSHDLVVSTYLDYATTPNKTWTWTATGGATPLDSMPLPQVSLDPPGQRCQAMSWEISDATPTGASVGTGQGSLFAALALDIETEGNSWELPAAQKG
jgi:hypothetical protein